VASPIFPKLNYSGNLRSRQPVIPWLEHSGGIKRSMVASIHTFSRRVVLDGYCRLWDIRKAGSSRSCLAVLNRMQQSTQHLPNPAISRRRTSQLFTLAATRLSTQQMDYSGGNAVVLASKQGQRGRPELAPNYQAAASAAVSLESRQASLCRQWTLSTPVQGRRRTPLWRERWFRAMGAAPFLCFTGEVVTTHVDPTSNRTPLIATHDGDCDAVWIGNGSRLAAFSNPGGEDGTASSFWTFESDTSHQAIPDTMQLLTCASDVLT
jgi:hypothetical protein